MSDIQAVVSKPPTHKSKWTIEEIANELRKQKSRNIFAILLFWLLLTPDILYAQSASSVKISVDSAGLGDPVLLDIRVVLPGDKTFTGLNFSLYKQIKNQIYLQDTSNITGSDQEASMVRREMRRDLVQQMVLRLEQLTPERLAELQKLADEKAQAEAAAIEAARKAQEETPQQSPLELQNQ